MHARQAERASRVENDEAEASNTRSSGFSSLPGRDVNPVSLGCLVFKKA